MALDDLDLEFEDEDEAKKKKEAVDVDVDLEFQAPEGVNKPRPQPGRPANAGTSLGASKAQRPQGAEVRNIGEARAPQAQVARPAAAAKAGTSGPGRVAGTSALKEGRGYDLESHQVVELQEQMRRVELESQVKVAVAEFKVEFLTEMLSDMKLASHQVEQLLIRINAKHPDMKNEVLMIKKILADFLSKKRK